MAQLSEQAAEILAAAQPLPIEPRNWQKIVKSIGLSEKQSQIVELMLRDLSDREIALVLGISESTVETHQERIGRRTGTRGRMQLAMHVLAVSHQLRS